MINAHFTNDKPNPVIAPYCEERVFVKQYAIKNPTQLKINDTKLRQYRRSITRNDLSMYVLSVIISMQKYS